MAHIGLFIAAGLLIAAGAYLVFDSRYREESGGEFAGWMIGFIGVALLLLALIRPHYATKLSVHLTTRASIMALDAQAPH